MIRSHIYREWNKLASVANFKHFLVTAEQLDTSILKVRFYCVWWWWNILAPFGTFPGADYTDGECSLEISMSMLANLPVHVNNSPGIIYQLLACTD